MTNKKVLIVDDIYLNRYVLFQYIKNIEGLEILFADDGDVAVDIVRKNNDISLIFMDIRMNRLSGDQASYIIKNEINNEIPIIALTAYDIHNFNNGVFNDVLQKPINNNEVKEILNKYI